MKKPVLNIEEITQLGFQLIEKHVEMDESEAYYNWWVFYKNDSELHLTYEYDADDNFTTGYVDFNGEKLKGRELQKTDFELLIELM